MKISLRRLRQMIVEEVGRTDEALWPSPPYLGPVVVVGGVYRNRK